MKKLLIFSLALLYLNLIFAQNNDIRSVGMQTDFNEIHKIGGESLHTYSSSQTKGSQFFSPEWAPGSVTTNNKIEINHGYSFLFDKVRQYLFIKTLDSSLVVLGDNSQIYSFTLTTDKTHLFEKASIFDPFQKNMFYEVLVKNDSGYTLLKYVKTTFNKADMSDMIKVKNGDMSDEFKDKISYYVSYQNGLPQKLELRKKDIKKSVPISKAKEIDDFFQQNKEASINEQFLINLIQKLNK